MTEDNKKKEVENFIHRMNNWYMNRERELNQQIKTLGYNFKSFVSWEQIEELNIEDYGLKHSFNSLYVYKDAYFDIVEKLLNKSDEDENLEGDLKGLENSLISKSLGND